MGRNFICRLKLQGLSIEESIVRFLEVLYLRKKWQVPIVEHEKVKKA
jgi:hypothetical protein